MASSSKGPLAPRQWCRRLLQQLSSQAGLVHDADALHYLLTTLAEENPDAETFPALLEIHTLDPRPEVSAAAQRIQRAWARHVAETTGGPRETKPHILIVDDEPDTCEVMATALERRFDVSIATSGEAALEQARAQPPALVVLDVMMPGMDGYSVARALRADPATAHARILFCTARGGINARLLGRELGADGYVVKPVDLWRLAAQAANLLGLDPLDV